MALARFRILIHELLNKDTDTVPEEAPLVILDIKYYVCMDNNDKDTKHTRHISRRVNHVKNGKKCKIHKIVWCEGGLQLADIATKNFGENDLNLRTKYIMVSLDY